MNINLQKGVASLIVILVILMSLSVVTLYFAKVSVIEQKISSNGYKYKQVFEAADAGVDHGLSWLSTNNPIWVADPVDAGFVIDGNNLKFSAGNYSIAVNLRRSLAKPNVVSIESRATDANGSINALSRIEVIKKSLLVNGPEAPLIINGCLNSVTGAPNIQNYDGGIEIVSSQDSSGGCIDTGHFNQNGPPPSRPPAPDVRDEAFSISAWDRTFGITQAELQKIAIEQAASIPNIQDRTVLWINDASEWHTDLGQLSPTIKPVIAIFNACQKINGNTVIVGIVYYQGPCNVSGWGGGKLYGSIVVEGNMAGMNSNSVLNYSSSYVNIASEPLLGIQAKLPGSWFDR